MTKYQRFRVEFKIWRMKRRNSISHSLLLLTKTTDLQVLWLHIMLRLKLIAATRSMLKRLISLISEAQVLQKKGSRLLILETARIMNVICQGLSVLPKIPSLNLLIYSNQMLWSHTIGLVSNSTLII